MFECFAHHRFKNNIKVKYIHCTHSHLMAALILSPASSALSIYIAGKHSRESLNLNKRAINKHSDVNIRPFKIVQLWRIVFIAKYRLRTKRDILGIFERRNYDRLDACIRHQADTADTADWLERRPTRVLRTVTNQEIVRRRGVLQVPVLILVCNNDRAIVLRKHDEPYYRAVYFWGGGANHTLLRRDA